MPGRRRRRSISRMDSLRIAIVDDDSLQRDRLRRLLDQAGLHCGFSAANGAEFLAWLGAHELDLLLVDLGLPDLSGVDLIRALRRRQPRCHCLVLTLFADEAHLLPALAAGADGYLLKGVDEAELGEHVQHLLAGGSPLSPLVARGLLRHWQHSHPDRAPDPRAPSLTARELEVLQQVARGFSYAEIAQRLGVAPTTVQTHVRGVYAKLGVHTKTEAVFEARQAGLLH